MSVGFALEVGNPTNINSMKTHFSSNFKKSKMVLIGQVNNVVFLNAYVGALQK